MSDCLVCNSSVEVFADFGDMPIANAFCSKDEASDFYTFRMAVGFCGTCKMIQLIEQQIVQ